MTITIKDKKPIKGRKRGRPKKSVKKIEPEIRKEKEILTKKKKPTHYLYAVGRRKEAVARVRYYKKGEGKIIINKKNYTEYFPDPTIQKIIISPLELINWDKSGDITIKVLGGGKKGQAGSIRHGISRILVIYDQNTKVSLKKAGFLTRDPREKERKKYGLKGARRAPQWQKR